MSTKQTSGNLALVKSSELEVVPYFPDLSDMAEVMRDNMGASASFRMSDLDRVKMPAGGGLAWSVPGLDGEPEVMKEIEGVIIAHRKHRGLFLNAYSGETVAPDCFSEDMEHGSVEWNSTFGGACASCPLGKFKMVDKKWIAPQCKPRMRLFIMTKGSNLPLLIDLPSSSVRTMEDYLKALTKWKMSHWKVITKLGLEVDKSQGGIAFSKIKPRVLRDEANKPFVFGTADLVQLRQMKDTFEAMLDRTKTVEASEPPATATVVESFDEPSSVSAEDLL